MTSTDADGFGVIFDGLTADRRLEHIHVRARVNMPTADFARFRDRITTDDRNLHGDIDLSAAGSADPSRLLRGNPLAGPGPAPAPPAGSCARLATTTLAPDERIERLVGQTPSPPSVWRTPLTSHAAPHSTSRRLCPNESPDTAARMGPLEASRKRGQLRPQAGTPLTDALERFSPRCPDLAGTARDR